MHSSSSKVRANSHQLSGKIFILITAANCRACRALESSGEKERLKTALESRGATFIQLQTPLVGGELRGADRFTAYANRNLKLWYPLLVCLQLSIYNYYNLQQWNPSDHVLSKQIKVLGAYYDEVEATFAPSIEASIDVDTVLKWCRE